MKKLKSHFIVEDSKIYIIDEIPKICWFLYDDFTKFHNSSILNNHIHIGNYFGKRYKTYYPKNTFYLLKPKIRNIEKDMSNDIIIIEPKIIEIPKIVIKNVKKQR